MPLFSFTCKRCGKDFEVFLGLSDTRQDLICSFCEGGEVEEIPNSERKEPEGAFSTQVCGPRQET